MLEAEYAYIHMPRRTKSSYSVVHIIYMSFPYETFLAITSLIFLFFVVPCLVDKKIALHKRAAAGEISQLFGVDKRRKIDYTKR